MPNEKSIRRLSGKPCWIRIPLHLFRNLFPRPRTRSAARINQPDIMNMQILDLMRDLRASTPAALSQKEIQMANVRVPTDFPTIAAAMSNVNPGDTIVLDPGYSNETATVSVNDIFGRRFPDRFVQWDKHVFVYGDAD